MWKKILLGAAVVIVALGAIGYFFYGGQLLLLATLIFAHPPHAAFDSAKAPPAPDYSLPSTWAALPDNEEATAATPPGMAKADPGTAPVDVFFIYPTTFFSLDEWNQHIDDAATNARTQSGPLRGQASALNGCCAIYAPYYRQMTFGGFLKWSDNSAGAMNLAYSDVKRAFQYYLDHYNHGQPFIIASHSQGSRHATKLLPDMIDGTPLMKQFVGAYIIGTWLPQSWFDKMKDIKPCDSATDTGCVVTWSTLAEGSNAQAQRIGFAKREGHPDSLANEKFVCINPLSWSRDNKLAAAKLDLGGWMPWVSGAVPPIDAGLVSARCENGALFISKSAPAAYRAVMMPGGNYHNDDYQLFWMNIRKNAQDRVAAFLAAQH